MAYQVVIVAAGRGERMGAGKNKVLLPLAGEPIIIRTLRVFEQDPDCQAIILVVRSEEKKIFSSLIAKERMVKPVTFADGGPERQQSVYNGLLQVENDSDDPLVLIHDGARPFVPREKIAAVAEKAAEEGAAVLAVPVKDTIKKVEQGCVRETLLRESLRAVQTPQAFRLSVILRAYRAVRDGQAVATDDAALVEASGQTVWVVPGSYRNIKLTTPEDLLIAEKFLEEEEKEK